MRVGGKPLQIAAHTELKWKKYKRNQKNEGASWASFTEPLIQFGTKQGAVSDAHA